MQRGTSYKKKKDGEKGESEDVNEAGGEEGGGSN